MSKNKKVYYNKDFSFY